MNPSDNKPLMDEPAPPAYSAAVGPQPATAPPPYSPLPAPNTVTVVHVHYEDQPVPTKCLVCGNDVVTRVEYNDGTLVWVAAGVICLLGGWFGCCLIPFCVDSMKDVIHYCPNCNSVIGKFERIR